MYSSTHSLTSALDGGEWSASRPDRFIPRETAPGIHWMLQHVTTSPSLYHQSITVHRVAVFWGILVIILMEIKQDLCFSSYMAN
jgi:hypothetical protein